MSGYWRGSCRPTTISSATESLIDELRWKAGKDPIAFRLCPQLDGTPAPESGGAAGGRKRRAGAARCSNGWTRVLRAILLSAPISHGSRSRSGTRWRGRAPGPLAVMMPGCQSRNADSPGAGRTDVRFKRRALRRHHLQGRAGAAEEFQRLPHQSHSARRRPSTSISSIAMRHRAAIGEPAARRDRPSFGQSRVARRTASGLRKLPIDRDNSGRQEDCMSKKGGALR